LNELNRYEESITSYEKVVALCTQTSKIDPDRTIQIAAWHNRGNALKELQQYEEALYCYQQALELAPSHYLAFAVWYSKGLLLSKLERYEEAFAAYDRAIQVESNNESIKAWVWQDRGKALEKLQRHEEALHSYNKALEISSNSCDALCSWYGKGLVLTYLELYEEAIAAFDQLFQIRLDNLKDDENTRRIANFEVRSYPHLMIYLGTAYALQGNIEEAQKQWQKGLEVCQEDVPWLKLSRGLYKIALGEIEESIAEMQTVLGEEIPKEMLQNAIEDAEMLARCSVEGSDRVVQLLQERLKIINIQN
jgi:tetratricopeptide (TPR) repeat protein